MKMEVVLLGKNFYEMDNNRGANVVVYGEYEDTNNKTGMSISEASIDFYEHSGLTVFPAKYSATAQMVGVKNRAGKIVTTLKLSDFKLIEELEFVKTKVG